MLSGRKDFESHGSITRATRQILVALAVVMALGDALENRQLLFLSGASDPAAMLPPLARLQVFTRIKWYAIFVACALLAVGIWHDNNFIEAGCHEFCSELFGRRHILGSVEP
jgi:hypothetical protein